MVIYHDKKEKNNHLKHIQDNAGSFFESSNYATKKHAIFFPSFFQLEGRRMSNKQDFRRTSKCGGGSAIPWLLCSKLFF